VTQLGETLIGTIIKYKSKASLTYLSLHIPSISCSSSKEEKKEQSNEKPSPAGIFTSPKCKREF
jgi:hypothetical protein